MLKKDKKSGRYIRTVRIWNPEIWNEGHIDNRGRFRVYAPWCSKKYGGGYVFRSFANWEYNNGAIPKGYDIHHKNKNKLDDSIENLEIIKHNEHAKLHNKITFNKFVCKRCNKQFVLTGKEKHGNRYKNRYCSAKCFENRGRTFNKFICKRCAKVFIKIKSNSYVYKYCSVCRKNGGVK